MLDVAFWILLVTAIGGASIAALGMAARPVRLGHGALALVGLACLLLGALDTPSILAWAALGLNALGFIAGAFFFGLIYKRRGPPKTLVVGHGVINIAGVVVLAVAVFS